ncbi:MAG TPA: hypothetical protein VMY35_17345 [Phycisphaerae bacterium]|nr:hypothetical protein [Thermoguttaceae bacterium]HUX02730.1 hypothetical protein [Phycisphaerae bacterium]
MKTFKDRKGREWMIDVNLTSIARVHDLCGVKLTDLADVKSPTDSLVFRLLDDPLLQFNVLHALLMPQMEAKGIEPEDFGAAMAGDPIDDATTAVLGAVVDFFPNQRDRTRMQKGLAMVNHWMETARTALESPAIQARIERQLKNALSTLTSSDSNSAESSRSPPTGEPSAS